jgi:hypothetical protein
LFDILKNIKSPNLRLAMTAIAGVTVSSISGGKFANGAVFAAFVMMYNDMAHEVQGSRLLKNNEKT